MVLSYLVTDSELIESSTALSSSESTWSKHAKCCQHSWRVSILHRHIFIKNWVTTTTINLHCFPIQSAFRLRETVSVALLETPVITLLVQNIHSHTHTHTHSHTLSLSLTHAHTQDNTHTRQHTLSHACTHMHTYTRQHTHKTTCARHARTHTTRTHTKQQQNMHAHTHTHTKG